MSTVCDFCAVCHFCDRSEPPVVERLKLENGSTVNIHLSCWIAVRRDRSAASEEEREACARVCDDYAREARAKGPAYDTARCIASKLAELIRMRGVEAAPVLNESKEEQK